MPIKAVDQISFDIFKDGTKIGTLSNIIEDKGTIQNGTAKIPYRVEKFNSSKNPLGQDESDIYFIRVIFDDLELGNYSVEVSTEGYINTKVDNIELYNYSKRVILGSSSNGASGYNGVFLAGDVNGDSKIDMGDYELVFKNFGKVDSDSKKPYDINKDGYIDIADLTYVNDNIGSVIGNAEIINIDEILNLENVTIKSNDILLEQGANIKDLLVDSSKTVSIGLTDDKEISEQNPLRLSFDFAKASRSASGVEMEQIVIKVPEITSGDAGVPEKGYMEYVDENGDTKKISFGDTGNQAVVARIAPEGSARTTDSGDIVIDLGSQVAVKEISINVTGNRGNKKISEIAKIEFLNNVYKEIPAPQMNIPQIKTVETCTNLHDERITLSWEAQPNVTAYEVKYEKLDDKGNVTSTKKLQTNKTSFDILDKDIKPYDLYRVSLQSLNGDWESGYEDSTKVPTAFDGIADNVDADFNPIADYYNNDKGTVSEIRVVPIQAPEKPRNLTTEQGFKSFTVSWENHPQARDFDIYYRKVGDTNKNWIKANEDRIEVTENSPEVTNPDKSKLVRSHSYVINGLEDNTAYEVRVTATNHLGTSKMSDTYIASTVTTTPPAMTEYKLINRPTDENEIGTTHIIDVRNKLDADGWASSDSALQYDSEYALVDGDFTTEWKVNDWDTGASYGADRGSEITFDDTYTIGSIGIGRTLEKGNYMGLYKVKVTYWDENGDKQVVYTESVTEKSSNGHNYYKAYFRKHRAPLTRLNIKYQRMMMGAAAYASSHHIGVGFGSAHYIQGVPYKFDAAGNVINADEAKLYGGLIGHEMGHCMDIADRLYPETSNNLMAAITGTMLDEDSPYASAMDDLYKKVTSNTLGLSTDRTVVLNMLWQPYLAYEDDSTYKMLFTDNDADLSNDSYYAKLNRAYREMTAEERADGDRDQWLIRMSSKAVGKDLTDFYEAHGIVANATTLQYVAQFPKETRKIQYINEEARRRRMAGTADMAQGTTLSAEFGTDSKGNLITSGSYVNDKNVTINLSVDKSDDNILGYEIYRNGEPCGFIVRDKDNKETIYTDVVDNMNNRVVTYSAVAYDYNLNTTNTVELGTVKVRHDGGIAKSNTILTTNTISVHEDHNDIHSSEGNEDLKLALDDDNTTAYEGRMLSKSEYNNSVHGVEMNPNNDPYVILDTTEIKTLVGIKYTAPVETTGFIFKKSAVASSALNKYKIEVSKDGVNWTTAKEGTLSLAVDSPTATIYFDKEGVTGGNQLNSYNARYVKITALGTKNISAAELELLTPPGDNIEIGVSKDNINYENGIGILKERYIYQVDNPDTAENEERAIPAGSIIITGEYRGNPAFNVPLVLNQNNEHIADKYKGILLAEVPDNGDLEEIAEGTWIYWVEPQDATTFMVDNEKIFAELYRTDAADGLEGGQRLVSDTFKIKVPDKLEEISLTSRNTISRSSSTELKAIEINEDVIMKVTENR